MSDLFKHGFVNPAGIVPISIKPFTSVDLENEVDVRRWMTDTTEQLMQYYGPYRRMWAENIAIYTGMPFQEIGFAWAGGAWDRPQVNKSSRNNLNIINPIVEAHLARITSSRAKVSVLPVHKNEYKDLSAAKTAEKLVEMSFRDRKINDKLEDVARCMLVCGHAYILAEWNQEIGPAMPELEEELPVIDEDTGEPVVDEEGNPIIIRPDYKIGDVDYRVLTPDQVLEQPGKRWEDKDWIIRVETEDVYKLREMYPTVALDIKPGDFHPSLSLEHRLWRVRDSETQTPVIYMYHKATKTFPEGRLIICTPDVVLENTSLPFPSLNKASLLPLARVTDTCPPGFELPIPLTVMQSGKAYQRLFNNINSNITRNMSLNVPKWIVHSGSGVRLAHLNNASNIVQYKGSVRPTLDSPPSTPTEFFAYRESIRGELEQVTGASHIFNQPPANTRAGVMLEHQEEQEFRRSEPLIRHMNDLQSEMAKIALSIMSDKYDDSDERVLKLMGPGGSGKFIRFLASDLQGPFDVKYERTSALPESKQGRLNMALQLFNAGLMDKQQFKAVVGYSSDPSLGTAETKAYEKQLLENDLMMRGHQVSDPRDFEDHVEALRALYPLVQSVEFAEAPEEVKSLITAHTFAHEMFAQKRAMVSTLYAVRLSQLTQYPTFFTALPAAVPISPEMPPTPVEDVIRRNLEATGGTGATARLEGPGPDSPESV